MIFSKIATALISPLGTVLVLGVVAVLFGGLRRRCGALWLGVVALFWLWIWSLPVASLWLRGVVEESYPPVAASQLPLAAAIVVLGGSIVPPDRRYASADLTEAVDRLRFTAQLYHAGKAPWVVLSGGSDREVSLTSEAAAMRLFLRELGVPDSAMVLEEASRTTRENARFTDVVLRERGIERILLVTSALHMRRALGLFEAEGIEVVPAPTDHEARAVARWQQWLPDAGALEGSGRAMKEWVGQRLQAL